MSIERERERDEMAWHGMAWTATMDIKTKQIIDQALFVVMLY